MLIGEYLNQRPPKDNKFLKTSITKLIKGDNMANNCLKCNSEILDDRIYCDDCII